MNIKILVLNNYAISLRNSSNQGSKRNKILSIIVKFKDSFLVIDLVFSYFGLNYLKKKALNQESFLSFPKKLKTALSKINLIFKKMNFWLKIERILL